MHSGDFVEKLWKRHVVHMHVGKWTQPRVQLRALIIISIMRYALSLLPKLNLAGYLEQIQAFGASMGTVFSP